MLAGVLGAIALVGALVAPLPAAGKGVVGPGVSGSWWTVYHGQASGAGHATTKAPLFPLHKAWTATHLVGQLYGEPLVWGNRVYVATEANWVYALSARRGKVLWSRHLGMAVPSARLACGDISPTVGITGTPVIDAARGELFVVADRLGTSGAIHHLLYGLGLKEGRTRLTEAVDPPGSHPGAQLQRTGLALDHGRVVFGYGGNFGDCGPYRGYVVAVSEHGGALRAYTIDSGANQRQGAVWMGGAAPEVDGAGHLWVAVGNGSVTAPGAPYDGSDSVLELSSSLQLLGFFAPAGWAGQNANDQDLGSSSPALVGKDLVLQAGKSHTAYLLDRRHLGGVGGQLARRHGVCAQDVDGGAAVAGAVTYLPCQGGLVALATSASPPSVRLRWRTPTASGGTPVLDGGHLFSVDARRGILWVLSTANGRGLQHFSVGAVANHFPAPSAADGLVLVASSTAVHAFVGPKGLPPGPVGGA